MPTDAMPTDKQTDQQADKQTNKQQSGRHRSHGPTDCVKPTGPGCHCSRQTSKKVDRHKPHGPTDYTGRGS